VLSGKWYYEAEILTPGTIKIGWSQISSHPDNEIGFDASSYALDGCLARKSNGTTEPFGKKWAVGDIVGVMIDLQDHTISFSLNGELMLDKLGSETAFSGITTAEAYVPSFTLAVGQKVRLNFGQDVHSLKYFTNCGLQEGYEPFCVNMTRPITMWYSKRVPTFMTVHPDNESIEVARLNTR
jgi:ryanodine receptor 2